jgi:DNA end-binding protein Ku
MATGSRVLWKGAITFGLVHIPVSVHPATRESGVDFDWLDKRTMDPVGYKRINKKTGKEIDRDNIVKGVAYEDGQYVVLSDEEIKAAYPKVTQTIEIEAFVPLAEVPFVYLDRPYYLAPVGKGGKVYALLRETLRKKQRIGLARVVINTKQHLAALVPAGPVLVLDLLRWGADIRPYDDLPLPAEGIKANGLTERELRMAEQLVEDMTTSFKAEDFSDSFKEEVMALVERKVKEGKLETVEQPDAEAAPATSNVVDLTELLQKSLGRRGPAKKAEAAARPPARTAKSAAKTKAASKTESKASTKRRAA